MQGEQREENTRGECNLSGASRTCPVSARRAERGHHEWRVQGERREENTSGECKASGEYKVSGECKVNGERRMQA